MACSRCASKLLIVCIFTYSSSRNFASATVDDVERIHGSRHRIDGKLIVYSTERQWTSHAKVLVDGGRFLGIVKDDGSFSINNVQEGSYVVEVAHPTLVFNPARVDIRSNGKIRARTVDAVGGPAASRPLRYPLQFKARGRPQYFEKREKWLTEETAQQFLPMALMLLAVVIPLCLLSVSDRFKDIVITNHQQKATNAGTTNSMQFPFGNMFDTVPDLSEMCMRFCDWIEGVERPVKGDEEKQQCSKFSGKRKKKIDKHKNDNREVTDEKVKCVCGRRDDGADKDTVVEDADDIANESVDETEKNDERRAETSATSYSGAHYKPKEKHHKKKKVKSLW